jgi:uncharacterized protein (TIGR02145 family)
MKKPLFLTAVLCLILQFSSFGQSIKLNNQGDAGSAMLDVSSPSKGILIPNLALTGSTDVTTIISPAVSLLVYNTATVSDILPGYFYNSGTIVSPFWTRLVTDAVSKAYADLLELRLKAYVDSLFNPIVQQPSSVTIGNQIWTNKNLDVSTYRDGTVIPKVDDATWSTLTTGAYCYYNNDSTTYAAIYGKLYNWYAVVGIHDNDANTPNKTLAPEGWHVPTDVEWTTLTTYLGGIGVAGGKMKEAGLDHWGYNEGATNESGFAGLPGGGRYEPNAFNAIGNNGNWWSSTEYSATNAWYRDLGAYSGSVSRDSYFKETGFSVRCLRDEVYTIPDAPINVSATAGDGQATITYDAPGSNGGSIITSYTATSLPGGITGTVTQAGSGSITVVGLTNGTAYTFTVTATNAAGTSLASQPSSSVTPNVNIPSVTIGNQIWTNKNLDVSTYRDGTVIPKVDDATWANLTTGAYCYYNNDSTTYAAIYGKLYNWYAVVGIHDNEANTPNKTLAPEGWHVPTDVEWTTLTTYLGGIGVAGGKMKEAGLAHWDSPNTDATNESGFAGLPGGFRNFQPIFRLIGSGGYWWSSSSFDILSAYYRNLLYNDDNVSSGSGGKVTGNSVRCLRDVEP